MLASVVLLASVIFGVWWSKFRAAVYRVLPAADNQELQDLVDGNNDDNPDNNPVNNDDNPVPERKIKNLIHFLFLLFILFLTLNYLTLFKQEFPSN